MPSLSQKYLSWLLGRGRFPVLVSMLIITLVFSIFAVEVPIEEDTRSMSALQPQQTATYDRFLDRFGNDEDLLLSVTPPQLLSSPGIKLMLNETEAYGVN
jgi:predicted RND superfamily exporter protein